MGTPKNMAGNTWGFTGAGVKSHPLISGVRTFTTCNVYTPVN